MCVLATFEDFEGNLLRARSARRIRAREARTSHANCLSDDSVQYLMLPSTLHSSKPRQERCQVAPRRAVCSRDVRVSDVQCMCVLSAFESGVVCRGFCGFWSVLAPARVCSLKLMPGHHFVNFSAGRPRTTTFRPRA